MLQKSLVKFQAGIVQFCLSLTFHIPKTDFKVVLHRRLVLPRWLRVPSTEICYILLITVFLLSNRKSHTVWFNRPYNIWWSRWLVRHGCLHADSVFNIQFVTYVLSTCKAKLCTQTVELFYWLIMTSTPGLVCLNYADFFKSGNSFSIAKGVVGRYAAIRVVRSTARILTLKWDCSGLSIIEELAASFKSVFQCNKEQVCGFY